MRHSMLREKTARPGLQILRLFSGADFMSPILVYLPISRRALKSFMVMTVPHD